MPAQYRFKNGVIPAPRTGNKAGQKECSRVRFLRKSFLSLSVQKIYP